MKHVFTKSPEGWTYYVERRFAWLPAYCQGQLVWFWFYWVTWPEKPDGSRVLARDVLSQKDLASSPGMADDEMYVACFPYDPRERVKGDFES